MYVLYVYVCPVYVLRVYLFMPRVCVVCHGDVQAKLVGEGTTADDDAYKVSC